MKLTIVVFEKSTESLDFEDEILNRRLQDSECDSVLLESLTKHNKVFEKNLPSPNQKGQNFIFKEKNDNFDNINLKKKNESKDLNLSSLSIENNNNKPKESALKKRISNTNPVFQNNRSKGELSKKKSEDKNNNRIERNIRPESPNNAKKNVDFDIDRFNKKVDIKMVKILFFNLQKERKKEI